MSLNQLTLEMVFTGEDQTGNAISSVEEGIRGMADAANQGQEALDNQTQALINASKATRGHQRVQSLLRTELYQTHEEFFQGTKIIGGFGNAALKVNNVMTSFNVLQVRGQQLAEDEQEAFTRAGEAIRKYGANSTEARTAIKRLNDVRQQEKEFNQQLPFQYLAQGLALTSLAGDLGKLTLDTKLFLKSRQLGLFGGGAHAAEAAFSPGARSAIGNAVSGGENIAGSVAGGAAGGLASLGGKLKSFAGSGLGKIVLPLAAGVGTYEFLTQDETGKQINQYNPFTQLFNGLFALSHTPGEVAAARAQQAMANGQGGGVFPGAYASGGLGQMSSGGMNVNGPVYVVSNSNSPADVQAGLEQWGGSYK